MRYLLIILLSSFVVFGFTEVCAQQPDAASIKKQMSNIRKSTNWDDPAAAKEANEKIKALSQQLVNAGNAQSSGVENQSSSQTANQSRETNQNAPLKKMEMLGQIMKSAAQGKSADILLAEPVREQIKDEYKQDEAPKVNCIPFQEEMTVMVIDMSSPTVQLIIDQMENFKSVKMLIITGGKEGKPCNLEMLLTKAKHYPLEQLYIINFRKNVNKVPKSISNFPKLTLLALYNNNITNLPEELGSFSSLETLYVDMNPITTLTPNINPLNKLGTLGLANTKISDDELKNIKKQLPNCKILLQ